MLGASIPAELTAAAAPAWPEITSEAKPWTRWWWLGNILEEDALRSAMEQYAAAGLGGLEITPIYGVRGREEAFLPYLSAEFMERLAFVLEEGKRLGLGIDMATGTGWPFGGPWIEGDAASQYLAHRTWKLDTGGTLRDPVRFTQQPLVRVAGPRQVAIGELIEPIAANPDLQDLALDQVRFEKELPLVALIAVSSAGATLDLTSRVDAGGRLDWTAPAGAWTLYGLFQGWHGKMVERAGPGGEGWVIDHFSSKALAGYLRVFDEAFARVDGGGVGLRAFFNDSYEVDDAVGNADWTPRFLAEFRARRGYDLLTQLPALFGDSDDAGIGSRVLSDHRETISDLLLERFTEPWREWAHARGAIIRNQAHGSPANILDLYAASDIPEQEGSDILAMKLASSAAHVTGKRLASAETATWINEHFLGTLGEVKAAVDRFFLGGINHNCYHGTAFSPPGEPWPGFHFYASIELNPSNPIWRDFPVLNAYVARAQSFLQLGRPDEDVLLYHPIHDRWAGRGNGELPHFSGRERDGPTAAREAATILRESGVGFDFISDRLLAGARFVDGAIETPGGARHRALVLPETRLMPVETLARAFDLAEAGAAILFHRSFPEDVPGFGRLEERRARFRVFKDSLQERGREVAGAAVLTHGRGSIRVGENLRELLAGAGIEGETLVESGLAFVRRQTGAGAHYFLLNQSDRPLDGWVSLRTKASFAGIFDPMSGRHGVAATRAGDDGALSVYLQLQPGESRIVRVGDTPPEGEAFSYWRHASEAPVIELSGAWTVDFVAGGPELPATATIDEPASWTAFAGEAGRIFGGTAVYRATFARPAGSEHGARIDLGGVAESARVRVNGREVAALIHAPFVCDVPSSQLKAENTLEIEVTNLAANRIADLDRRGVEWKRFYNTNMPARLPQNRGPDGLFSAARWDPRPSGLIGPVALTPIERFMPDTQRQP